MLSLAYKKEIVAMKYILIFFRFNSLFLKNVSL
jgi:hypothetical protein